MASRTPAPRRLFRAPSGTILKLDTKDVLLPVRDLPFGRPSAESAVGTCADAVADVVCSRHGAHVGTTACCAQRCCGDSVPLGRSHSNVVVASNLSVPVAS